jgi:GNAT superfamily N-acetyltransferase
MPARWWHRALMSRPKLLLLDEPFLGVAAIIIRLSLTGFDPKRASLLERSYAQPPITPQARRRRMAHRPAMIRDQDRVEIRLTEEAEYRLPFTFIEALNEGTLFDRPAHVFRDAARQHRLFHVVNLTTENILATGVVQLASGGHKSPTQAEVGGLMVHPAARGFGIASLLVKVMMVYAVKESGRDAPDEQYLAHVVDGNGGPIHALLEAGPLDMSISTAATSTR